MGGNTGCPMDEIGIIEIKTIERKKKRKQERKMVEKANQRRKL